MKSLILKAPEQTSFAALPEQTRALIEALFAQWVWIGRAVDGYRLLDCVVYDGFQPAALAALPGVSLRGYWQTPDAGETVTTLMSLDTAEYLNFMPDVVAYDSAGNETSRTRPTEVTEFHSWGWASRI